MKDKLIQIIECFGINSQLKKLNEECYELIEAIRDYEDMYMKCDCDSQYLKNEKEHIEEELADMMVMLEQFANYYEIDVNKILKIAEKKVDRTIEIIENGYYKGE